MKAKRKPLEEMDPEDDLDIEIDDPKVEVVGFSLPSERQSGQIVASVDELIGCAGMGTVRVNALVVTAGNIFFIASEAAVALSRPPFKQSSNVNNDCLTGLEYETFPLSTKVI